jgi:hypothetical protein
MSETQTGKIQKLLEQAARQKDSTPQYSSVSGAERIFSNKAEAEELFSYLREKLFRIERWNDESVISSFALVDKNGTLAPPEKLAEVGDFIKITLPASGKDDWVKIIDIHVSPDEVVLTVQPSHNPTDKENEKTTSHFFTDDSTNNFCLQITDKKLSFYVIGLNEKTNTEETGGIIETARNVATANLGRYLGIQKTQWKSFCENFLEVEKEKE